MLDGVPVPSQDGLEGRGKLAKVVEHLQGHTHLGGVLQWDKRGGACTGDCKDHYTSNGTREGRGKHR